MNRILPFLALLCVCLTAEAQQRVTLLITVTNVPVTGNTLTINSSIRTWTNASTASTILTNLVSTNHATTNLFQQIASYPYSGGIIQQWASSNAIRLIGPFGGALSGLVTGNWASLTLSTQAGPSTYTALWPMENIQAATNRTNQASSFIYGLGVFSTNALPAGSTAVSNLVNLYSNQTVAGNKTHTGTNTFTNSAFLAGRVVNALLEVTNARISNAIIHTLISTNGTNHGLAFSSPGAYPNSQQFGGGSAGGGNSLSIGGNALSNGVALGYLAAAGISGIAIGFGADGNSSTNSIVIGQNVNMLAASNAVALGNNTAVLDRHHNSIVIGYAAASTTNDQVVLGSASHSVLIPGVVSAGTLTNSVLRGTNRINGRLDLTPRADASLANGNNAAIILGTNVYVRLSGATTIAALAGFAAEQDGSFHVVQFSGAVTNTFLNESGVDPTAANRIVTGTGADLSLTNTPLVVGLIYDGVASRWRILSFHR